MRQKSFRLPISCFWWETTNQRSKVTGKAWPVVTKRPLLGSGSNRGNEPSGRLQVFFFRSFLATTESLFSNFLLAKYWPYNCRVSFTMCQSAVTLFGSSSLAHPIFFFFYNWAIKLIPLSSRPIFLSCHWAKSRSASHEQFSKSRKQLLLISRALLSAHKKFYTILELKSSSTTSLLTALIKYTNCSFRTALVLETAWSFDTFLFLF